MSAATRFREAIASPLRAPKSASRRNFSASRKSSRSRAHRFASHRKIAHRYDRARQDRQSLQTDPIGYEDSFNLYMYALNDPITYHDPDGREVQRRELTLHLGPISISNGSYVASERGEPYRSPTPFNGWRGNGVEQGRYRSFSFGTRWGIGVEIGQYICRDCGPQDVAGNSATVSGDIGIGLSYSRNESGYRVEPGVGAIREYEGPETFGASFGISAGAAAGAVTETQVFERRPMQRALESAIGGDVRVRQNQDGSITVDRSREGSRIRDRTTCRNENGTTTCN